MNWNQKELTLKDVQGATIRQQYHIESLKRRLGQLLADPVRLERLKSHQCVVCYYSDSRIGGAAITTTNCRACNELLQFGSTCVDALCEPCARALRLCRHCGGDIELRPRRKLDTAAIVKVAPFEQSTPAPAWPAVMLLPQRESK